MRVNLKRIKGLMAENDDTQEDLARKLGVSTMTLYNYLSGKNEMRVGTLSEIAEIYKVPATELLIVKEP